MSISRSAGYRLASLVKVRRTPAPVGSSASLPPEPPQDLTGVPRTQIVAATIRAAATDTTFAALTKEADRQRDSGDWWSAEQSYAAALARYPYQPGYWVQLGHMRKEQQRLPEAEVAYRTAAALGVAARDVIEHLRFVMARQDASEGQFPIRFAKAGTASAQVPAREDVLVLARLLWNAHDLPADETLKLLRENASCDEVFAAMVTDPRFERANISWLTVAQDGDIDS